MNRNVGTIGTLARIILGLILFGSVFYGHIIKGPFRPLPWVIGLLVFPGIFLIWQYLRARRNPAGLEANSPVATLLNVVIFWAFYFTFIYAPSIDFMSDAVLIFYGPSMLVAALRGYGGVGSVGVFYFVVTPEWRTRSVVFLPHVKSDRQFSHGY